MPRQCICMRLLESGPLGPSRSIAADRLCQHELQAGSGMLPQCSMKQHHNGSTCEQILTGFT